MNVVGFVLVDVLFVLRALPDRAYDVAVEDVVSERIGDGERIDGLSTVSGCFLEKFGMERRAAVDNSSRVLPGTQSAGHRRLAAHQVTRPIGDQAGPKGRPGPII